MGRGSALAGFKGHTPAEAAAIGLFLLAALGVAALLGSDHSGEPSVRPWRNTVVEDVQALCAGPLEMKC